MSIQTLIFVGASVVVVIALLYALLEWSRVHERVHGLSRRAALLFCACFLLYACGQTLVIFQVLGAMAFNEWPSYLYAVAALLFALGSYYHRVGVEQGV